jgi:hypothetical protein
LTGETPYRGETVREILRAHRDAPVPELKEHAVEAPAGIQEFIAWLMAKDPADRPQDAHEIVDEIHDLLDGKKSRGLVIGLSVVAVGAVAVSLFFALKTPGDSDPEKVIVEVESDTAKQERERAERLELELAFTTAMAAEEGEARTSALTAFLETYPESDFNPRAQAEMERLASLPEKPSEPVETTDPFAAEKAQLKELESAFIPLLQNKAFGKARNLLNSSGLSAEWLAPLWSRLETASLDAFTIWERNHRQALDEEDWTTAAVHRNSFEASTQGLPQIPQEWTKRLADLVTAAESAKADADRRDYRLARLDVLTAMRERVHPHLEAWELAAAADALDEIQADCPHPELQEALAARIPLVQKAANAQEALFQALRSESMVDIVEARDNKRAFATGAGSEGLELLVQVSGQRIERIDPWPLYATPSDLPRLLDHVLGTEQDVLERRSMVIVLAAHSLAGELSTWTTLPSSEQAGAVQSLCADWLELLHEEPFTEGSVGAEETFALQEFERLAASIASGDSYSAFLHAQALQEHFSLLGVLSSDGAATWGFRP